MWELGLALTTGENLLGPPVLTRAHIQQRWEAETMKCNFNPVLQKLLVCLWV